MRVGKIYFLLSKIIYYSRNHEIRDHISRRVFFMNVSETLNLMNMIHTLYSMRTESFMRESMYMDNSAERMFL